MRGGRAPGYGTQGQVQLVSNATLRWVLFPTDRAGRVLQQLLCLRRNRE